MPNQNRRSRNFTPARPRPSTYTPVGSSQDGGVIHSDESGNTIVLPPQSYKPNISLVDGEGYVDEDGRIIETEPSYDGGSRRPRPPPTPPPAPEPTPTQTPDEIVTGQGQPSPSPTPAPTPTPDPIQLTPEEQQGRVAFIQDQLIKTGTIDIAYSELTPGQREKFEIGLFNPEVIGKSREERIRLGKKFYANLIAKKEVYGDAGVWDVALNTPLSQFALSLPIGAVVTRGVLLLPKALQFGASAIGGASIFKELSEIRTTADLVRFGSSLGGGLIGAGIGNKGLVSGIKNLFSSPKSAPTPVSLSKPTTSSKPTNEIVQINSGGSIKIKGDTITGNIKGEVKTNVGTKKFSTKLNENIQFESPTSIQTIDKSGTIRKTKLDSLVTENQKSTGTRTTGTTDPLMSRDKVSLIKTGELPGEKIYVGKTGSVGVSRSGLSRNTGFTSKSILKIKELSTQKSPTYKKSDSGSGTTGSFKNSKNTLLKKSGSESKVAKASLLASNKATSTGLKIGQKIATTSKPKPPSTKPKYRSSARRIQRMRILRERMRQKNKSKKHPTTFIPPVSIQKHDDIIIQDPQPPTPPHDPTSPLREIPKTEIITRQIIRPPPSRYRAPPIIIPKSAPPKQRQFVPSGQKLIFQKSKPATFNSKPIKKSTYLGVISEGISKRLFGKATLGKTKFREIGSPTAELEKAGITSPGQYLSRGGFFAFKKR